MVERQCKPLTVAVGIYKPERERERETENVNVGGDTVQGGSTIVVIQL